MNTSKRLDRSDFQEQITQGTSLIGNDNGAELIARTKKIFEPRYGRVLSDDETKQIISNYAVFFTGLTKCTEDKIKAKSSNPSTSPIHRPQTTTDSKNAAI